jgi:hypothetical protein
MPVNYQLGKIYKLVNTANATIYVGSTAQKYISTRKCKHVSNSKDPTMASKLYTSMRVIGAERFTIVLIKLFPCTSKAELESEEYCILDRFIVAGVPVYNSKIQGKRSEETRKFGMDHNRFSFGGITCSRGKIPTWVFQWRDGGKRLTKAFSVIKYGNYGAQWRAEQVRREIYPEWGNDEDCLCDDFGEIEWEV